MKLQKDIECLGSWARKWYEISTCQMQHDAVDEKFRLLTPLRVQYWKMLEYQIPRCNDYE